MGTSSSGQSPLHRRDLLRFGLFGGLASAAAGCETQKPPPADPKARAAIEAIQAAPVYDLSPFTLVPESLLHYELQLRLRSPLGDARALAVAADGSLLVVGSQLVRLGPDGQELQRLELQNQATAIGADAHHVVVALADRIVVFDRELKLQTEGHSLGENALLCSVAISGERIATTDFGQRMVWMLDLQGRPQGQIDGKTETEPHGFHLPSPYFACAFTADADVMVVNAGRHRIETWRDGQRLAAWGQAGMDVAGFSGCCNPTHIAVLANGDVLTSEKGLPRVKRYAPDGTLRSVIAAPSQFKSGTQGLALAVEGDRIWVLDPKQRQLLRFVPKEDRS